MIKICVRSTGNGALVPGEKEGNDRRLSAPLSEEGVTSGSHTLCTSSTNCPLMPCPLSSYLSPSQELQKYEQFIFADHTNMIHVENVYEEILHQSLLDETLKGKEDLLGAESGDTR